MKSRKMQEQANGHHLDGLDKYFQVLPLVENFLNETDPQLKKDNGIFFTPYPVVSFIVRSIHEILKEKLGKPLVLADETVKILDPAAGTGVFLIAAARLAIDEMARIFGKEKAHAFARQYMLNNLYGIEKQMSLYAVSCLKLAHFFQSLNLRLHANERFQENRGRCGKHGKQGAVRANVQTLVALFTLCFFMVQRK